MPTVRLARTEKSMSEELRTPHSSLENPLMDTMKAEEMYGSSSDFRSPSWNSFLYRLKMILENIEGMYFQLN